MWHVYMNVHAAQPVHNCTSEAFDRILPRHIYQTLQLLEAPAILPCTGFAQRFTIVDVEPLCMCQGMKKHTYTPAKRWQCCCCWHAACMQDDGPCAWR
jgi:hypothetical protein